MKVTYSWLKEYCPFDLTVEALEDRITETGLEVETREPLGDDWLLDVKVTANRSDLLSLIGVAREIAAATGAPLKAPSVEFCESAQKAHSLTSVRVNDTALCPRYTARVIQGVKVGPSPAWLVKRIESLGLRSINNIVDVTNFVMLECGQPLHAFDFDLLRGRRIVVRRAAAGERLTAIDGSKHDLNPDILVIADESRPVAVAGVMGGLETEVGAVTKNVLLESALFNQVSIRRTSRRLGLASDSSYRFERGVDPVGVEWASRRAARLIQEAAGGQIAAGVIDASVVDLAPKSVAMRFARLSGLLGMDVPADAAVRILQSLGFEVRERDAVRVVVAVPGFRQADVYREADLIEEVGRLHGYDNLPNRTTMKVAVAPRSKTEIVRGVTRDLLLGAGYSEAVTISLLAEKASALVSPWTEAAPMRVQNPMVKGLDLLRRSLIPGLLEIKQINQRHGVGRAPDVGRVAFFDLANVYLPVAGQEIPRHQQCLAILEEEGFGRLKGAVEMLLDRLGLAAACEFAAGGPPVFAAEERCTVMLSGKPLGFLGRLAAEAAAAYDLRTPPFLAELDFDLLAGEASLDKRFRRLPAFPAVVRDLAVVVPENVTWNAVRQCVRQAGAELLAGIQFFDVYRGKQILEGRKSLAFSLTFQSPARTLTSKEVDDVQSAIVAALAQTLGAELRK